MKSDDLFLIVDMQNVYDKNGKWECLNTQKSAQNIIKILEDPRFNKNAVFTKFIANEKDPKGVWADYNIKYKDVNNDAYANELLTVLKPYEKLYPVYNKSVYSSLGNKIVLEMCRKAKRVIIAGVVAECCVLSTCLNLMDEGIYTVYLTDAVSGLDTAKENATLKVFEGLSPLHIKIMSTEDYLNEN